jgi:hypothetical protein
MAYSRYGKTDIFLNKDKNYKNVFFRRRGIEETYQYEFPRLSYPTNDFIEKYGELQTNSIMFQTTCTAPQNTGG